MNEIKSKTKTFDNDYKQLLDYKLKIEQKN